MYYTFVFLLLWGNILLCCCQVGINIQNPDTNSILHIRSDKKGVLFPAIPASAIENVPKADGMFFFNATEKRFYYYNSKTDRWQCLNAFLSASPEVIHSGLVASDCKVRVTGAIYARNVAPVGTIIMWSGTQFFDSTGLGLGPLDGWAFCNGNNSTPDLRGKFIKPGEDAGGQKEFTYSCEMLRKHEHKIKNGINYSTIDSAQHHVMTFNSIRKSIRIVPGAKSTNKYYVKDIKENAVIIGYNWDIITGNGTSNDSSGKGGLVNKPWDNRPPYYTLCFIKRIK